jgi:dienelactone hydrolase
VVLTEPYLGIDWTGEALDARWAASQPQPDGMYLDVDGPAFDGTSEITYQLKSPTDGATDAAIYLLDGFGVVEVYGRFYAGGSVRDDVADMAAGMWFAAEQPAIDKARIGVFGASWGGFEGLYAAQQADPRARPAAVAVGFPVSDFAMEVAHAATTPSPVREFFIPYLHRIYASTGGPATQAGTDYHGLGTADLCAGLPAATLVMHDEDDDLVPVGETRALAATCAVTPMYWDRATPPTAGARTHGPITDEVGLPSWTTFGVAYLGLRILAPDQQFLIVAYAKAAMLAQLATARAAQLAGRDVAFEAPRLLELCDPKLYLMAIETCTAASCPTETGATVVAALVNQTWGTSLTAQTIAAQLAVGLPP